MASGQIADGALIAVAGRDGVAQVFEADSGDGESKPPNIPVD